MRGKGPGYLVGKTEDGVPRIEFVLDYEPFDGFGKEGRFRPGYAERGPDTPSAGRRVIPP